MSEFPESHEQDLSRMPAGSRRVKVVIVLIGAVVAAGVAIVTLGGPSVPSADPFAFDPSEPGTDVAVPDRPPAPTEPPAAVTTPEAAATSPAPVVGAVSVQSAPSGAIVTIDGRLSGTTPVTVADLTPGPHVIQVARPGYVPIEERVDVTAERPTHTIDVRLMRGSGATGESGTRGSLRIESRPAGAVVLIDGRRAGITPLTAPDLPAGRHVIEFTRAGYRTLRTDVVVRGGERTRVGVSLEPGTGGRRD